MKQPTITIQNGLRDKPTMTTSLMGFNRTRVATELRSMFSSCFTTKNSLTKITSMRMWRLFNLTRSILNKMKFCMSRTSNQNKVLNSIIIPDSVNMMDEFIGIKIATKFLFHFKSTSFYISSALMRMIRKMNKNISSLKIYSTFPITHITNYSILG